MPEQFTILLTGAAGGIGSVIAEYFAAAGCRLLLTDIDSMRLAELAGKLHAEHGADVHPVAADITTEHDRKQLVGLLTEDPNIVLMEGAHVIGTEAETPPRWLPRPA